MWQMDYIKTGEFYNLISISFYGVKNKTNKVYESYKNQRVLS